MSSLALTLNGMDQPPTPFGPLARTFKDPDPAKRAKHLGAALDAVPQLQAWLRGERQQAVQEMRAAGMSHGDVAKELGISRARAQQIAEGRTTGKRKDEGDAADGA